MKLQEFQAKRIFGQYGIPVPEGDVATTPAEARAIAERIGGPVVVKSQVLVGGRGKAGGIKLAKSPQEAEEMAGRILGMDIKGLTVKKVLVDPAADIKNEIYLGMILDRATRRVIVMASAAGGMDIEEVAATTPEKIITVAVDPCLGLREYQTRDIALKMDLPREQLAQFAKICQGLYACYMDIDASLAEINPLAALGDGTLKALDGKIVLDDSALFRHPDLAALRDEDEETPEEQEARLNGLSYVQLDGEIGCMVNATARAWRWPPWTSSSCTAASRRTSSMWAAARKPTKWPLRSASFCGIPKSKPSSLTSSAALRAATRSPRASSRRFRRSRRRCRWSSAWSARTPRKAAPSWPTQR